MISNVDLQSEMISKIKPFITSIDDNEIYALSFELGIDGNPCELDLTVCYNTERDYQNELTSGYNLLAHEARWDCAYWPREDTISFGSHKNIDSVKQWIADMGLPYLIYEEFFDTEMSDSDFNIRIDKYSVIEVEFMKMVVSVIKHLHESGFIRNKFGKDIPLIIYVHGDGCDVDELIMHNIEANTLPLVQEFIDFLMQTR